METPVWLAAVSVLFAIIGTLVLMGIKDISRRIRKLEELYEKLADRIKGQ